MPERFALVLAGGRGERFWPWSRPERPKQLLPLASGQRTLLAATLERVRPHVPPERTMVLTAADLVAAVARECPPGTWVVGEPVGRNTAPAIGAAAHAFTTRDPAGAFAVLPADHAIDDGAAWDADLERAFALAEREPVLVTFGIPPTGPSTSFGYIRHGARLAERLHRVSAFVEKPARDRAEAFLASGEYAWNSGIFVWRSQVFLDALEAGRPGLASTLAPLRGVAAGGFEAALGEVLPQCEAISVDYAVLESAPHTVVLDAAFDWDDLGSWHAWARRQPRDDRGNVCLGDAVVVDSDDCVVVGEGGTAAALGLRGMVVVHVHGASMSCPMDRTEEVRRIVESLGRRRA